MRHISQSTLPSTLSGIKRLARSIGRQDQIPHFQALDVVAQRCGYENYHHARRALERAHVASFPKHSHSIFLSAYWRDMSKKPVEAGLETLRIELPRPLLSFLLKHQCGHARNLHGFYIEHEDHVELRSDVDSQERARELLYRAALALQFIEASGLRPATTKAQWKRMKLLGELPGGDHLSRWVAPSGQWLVLDEPYDHVLKQPDLGKRESWVREHNLHWARPAWKGLYYPGNAVPHLIAVDREVLDQVVQIVESLPMIVSEDMAEWPGNTQTYASQFVSPARQTAGTKRKPRLGTTYGASRNAIEYRRRAGHRSLWRPDRPMGLANHVVVGEELKRLYISETPHAAHEKLSVIQSELEDWMYSEDRWEQRESTESEAYYGGARLEGYQEVGGQLTALDRVRSILISSYPDCSPLRNMLKRLDAVRAEIGGAGK